MSILGTDISGQGNHLVSANILPTDRMNDRPSNNFATFNPQLPHTQTLTEGNLKVSQTTDIPALSSIGVSSGKWYAEVKFVSGTHCRLGFANESNVNLPFGAGTGSDNSWIKINGRIYYHGGTGITSQGQAISAGDTIIMAVDVDAGKLWWGKDGTWDDNASGTGVPASGTNPTYTGDTGISAGGNIFFGVASGSGTLVYVANFGQDSSFAGAETAQNYTDINGMGDFYYEPPSGYLALCTKNLPESSVMPQEHFNTLLYTGSGSAAGHRGLGFRPNWIWGKKRGANAQNHWWITDVTDINKQLISDNDGSEGSEANGTAFDVDGFDSAGNDLFYNNNSPYVVWCWKGNGTNTSPSNTNGSINTQATNANIPAGFSITAWEGTGATATIGHGLSQAPQLIIVKNRDDDDNWCVLVNLVGGPDATDFLRLDADTAVVDDADRWNDTAPSATVFTVDTDNQVNGDGDNMVAWCFHSVEGYSKIGKYIGNGNANGPFVYTGFRPAFVLLKPLDDSGWKIFDNKREGFNGDGSNDLLQPNSNAAEGDADRFDILSNGFKNKSSSGGQNENGITFIYMAFAEIPFKYSNGR